jgi:DNA-binding transcriptional LysR family regulator
MCANAGVTPKIRTRAGNCGHLLSLAREGLGVAVLPTSMAGGHGLAVKPLEGSFERAITLGTVAGRKFSAASDAFVKLARTRDWGKAH